MPVYFVMFMEADTAQTDDYGGILFNYYLQVLCYFLYFSIIARKVAP